MRQVRVEVPATSANLGPGFDAFGLALDLGDTLTGELIDSGLEIEVEGEGAEGVPRDETHLVVRAMRTAFTEMGMAATGIRLQCTNRIPHSRGLGSSSAAIVGGLSLAVALAEPERRLDQQRILELANDLEGHPDNVAPALLGGFVISGSDADGHVWAHRFEPARSRAVTVFVPADGVDTEVARGLLPAQVPHRDAAANSGRAALLALGLMSDDDTLLWRGSEDRLHQDYREPAMPRSLALVRRLRAEGVAAAISGAGPTVLAFSDDPDCLRHLPDGWRGARHTLSARGARVVSA